MCVKVALKYSVRSKTKRRNKLGQGDAGVFCICVKLDAVGTINMQLLFGLMIRVGTICFPGNSSGLLPLVF